MIVKNDGVRKPAGAMRANAQERLASLLATAIVVAVLGYILFIGMTVIVGPTGDRGIEATVVPPMPVQPRRAELSVHRFRPRASDGPKAHSSNPVKALRAVAPLPTLLPLPALVAPRIVSAPMPSAGGSDQAGSGQGSGEGGEGGGGDGDGDDTPPRQIRGNLKYADLPADLKDRSIGGTVVVRYDVEVDGHVDHCVALGSSGNTELDQVTCRLIEQHFRFRPSRDVDNRPFVSTITEERHHWESETETADPSHP